MIKLSEEDMSNADRAKARLLAPNSWLRYECKGEIIVGNKKCYSSEHTNDRNAEEPYY